MNEQNDRFDIYLGDCVDVLEKVPENKFHFAIFSPPFASLYTYSNSPRDMGNVRSDKEFFAHFEFLVEQLYRVMKPGRLIALHCMLLPTLKGRDGFVGLRDFRGSLCRAFTRLVKDELTGKKYRRFIFHSEVCIWKDPVTSMQRTHAKGLLYKELLKDSASSRQGLADYLVIVRKAGLNPEPIKKGPPEWPAASTSKAGVEVWQRYASPIWATFKGIDSEGFAILTDDQVESDDSSGINPNDTLQFRSAREHADERHICPLQLPVIRRAVRLWSNPGDVVLSPFAGIGSEGYVSLEEGRRFFGVELKESYYRQAVKNLRAASRPRQRELFAE